MNNIISSRNNQVFSQVYSDRTNSILNTISEWYNRKESAIPILDYIIKSVACYGDNSHPSQTTIGKKANVNRGWANIITNKLVAMGLITKTRVIINGDEQACEYALTPLLKDRTISWMLKDMLPSLKLLHIFSKAERISQEDNTPYKNVYIKNCFKIVTTTNKSISRKQKSKIIKMQQRKNQENIHQEQKVYKLQHDYYEIKHTLLDYQYEKEQQDKLIAASQDQGLVNFMQGLLSGLI